MQSGQGTAPDPSLNETLLDSSTNPLGYRDHTTVGATEDDKEMQSGMTRQLSGAEIGALYGMVGMELK